MKKRPDARCADPAPKRVVALVSREHHCLGDLLVRNAFGELNARLHAVIGNHPVLAPLVEKFALPFHWVTHEGRSRAEHETELLGLIEGLQPDFLVLAKYMRVLSPEFVRRFPARIINIHHSFLPAFVGARPYHQAFTRGVKVIGATAHFVTDALDQGPIIVQQVMPVDHTHSPEDMAQAGRDVEQLALARALRLVFEDRVFLCGNRTVIFDDEPQMNARSQSFAKPVSTAFLPAHSGCRKPSRTPLTRPAGTRSPHPLRGEGRDEGCPRFGCDTGRAVFSYGN
jgi:formyltetrahydrofolate deformylase